MQAPCCKIHSFIPGRCKKTGTRPGCQEGLAEYNLLLPLKITMIGRGFAAYASHQCRVARMNY